MNTTEKTGIGRRFFMAGSASTMAAASLTAIGAAAAPHAAAAPSPAVPDGSIIGPRDPRYPDLMTGNNQRFVAQPEYVRLITSSKDAEEAVREAVRTGKKVSVRSGGHCFADFVCNPSIQVILDVSPMNSVYYDKKMGAFAVEPGARLMNAYETLYKNWGVTIPGGICYSVGVGGHIAGGGYGLLSRSHGLVVDHLYAVEVVTVDKKRKVRTVVATRDDTGELGDLWWAHTGGGGGNWGIVTKYWFRSPGARGKAPGEKLIKAPSTVLVSAISIPWEQLDEGKFNRLITNFGAWHEKYRDPGTPESHLSSLFNVSSKAQGRMGMFTQLDAAVPDAKGVMARYVAAILDGVAVTPGPLDKPTGELPAMADFYKTREIPWLQATRLVGTDNPVITNPTSRGAHKSAYMNKRFTDAQIAVLFKQMSRDDFTNPNTMLVLFSFGGQVNAVKPEATANVQRRSAFKLCLQTFWPDAADDNFYLTWERETFEGMFSGTGGVPAPNDQTDGCYINYPDVDMADPARNRSDVGWQDLYFKSNYGRLQKAKREWDPTNFFTHSLGVELPSGGAS